MIVRVPPTTVSTTPNSNRTEVANSISPNSGKSTYSNVWLKNGNPNTMDLPQ